MNALVAQVFKRFKWGHLLQWGGVMDPNGLTRRPWYRHQIYAPDYLTGYGAKTLPGVREAIEKKDAQEALQMAQVLTRTLSRMRGTLQEAVTVATGLSQ